MIQPDNAGQVTPQRGKASQVTPQQDKAVRPFRIDIPEEQLVDLRRRIAAMQWPDKCRCLGRSES